MSERLAAAVCIDSLDLVLVDSWLKRKPALGKILSEPTTNVLCAHLESKSITFTAIEPTDGILQVTALDTLSSIFDRTQGLLSPSLGCSRISF